MSPSARSFFTSNQKEEIKLAIQQAELNTSGEIRVHIESKCKEDVLDRAAFLFRKLEMHNTEQRNGVLIYLAVNSRKFAIIGDSGINQLTPDDFWDQIKEMMRENFVEGNFTNGLIKGIEQVGESLKEFFPYEKGDINELPDDISFKS
jgi:uncharacterized membrane protein